MYVHNVLSVSVANMYLEISPRQTGKSLRLLSAAFKHILETAGTSIIVTTNLNQANSLKKKWQEHFPTQRKSKDIKFVSASQINDGFFYKSDERFFFDDFDYMKLTDDLSDDFLMEGYWATCPHTLRTLEQVMDAKNRDLLVRLLRLNNLQHERICSTSPSMIWASVLSPTSCLMELFGVYLKED